MYLYILWKALDQEMCIQSKCSEQADFATYLSPCVCVPLRTRFTQTGYVVSVFTYDMKTEREWQANINNLTFLSGIVVLVLTVL